MNTIGIDIGGTSIKAGLVYGNQLQKKEVFATNKNGGIEVLNQIKEIICILKNSDITGIGIGVPSYVDVNNGIVYDVANINNWSEVHLKDILEKEFGLPVNINNDANCFALGEYTFGRGSGCRSMIGITLGTGVGTGIIINGNLYNGTNCGAGEISALPYKNSTYEAYTSSEFFTSYFKYTAKELADLAFRGDKYAMQVYAEFGKHLGEFFKVIFTAYDPELIVIGGSISKAYKLYEHSVIEKINNFEFKQYAKNIRIEISDNEDIAILGAASLCME